ncbi:RBBP9/YdeN family alpha/beta hydrolase [Novosphingobium lentum]|uniref:RBBP9/YdeN family alpha/beta hydrolase n=1 Tax=Novosphingobium lentum TaxID=145287 RepID=UPI0009FD0F0A|nr:alpha/beta hydrolase [Novosphingobium lentum]
MALASSIHAQSPLVLTVPGLDGSGPAHWQSLWEEHGNGDVRRVEMGEWDKPNRNLWVNRLNLAIHRATEMERRPVILVAHSLGCLTVAWWAHYEQPAWADPVIGALLVAPPEVDGVARDSRLYPFAPTPLGPLPFPSIVVASRDDPYAAFERTERLAHFWGSRFVDAGEAGHINTEAGLGEWRDGQLLLSSFSRRVQALRANPPPAIAPHGLSIEA